MLTLEMLLYGGTFTAHGQIHEFPEIESAYFVTSPEEEYP